VLASWGELWVADVSAERRAFAVKAGVAADRAVRTSGGPLPHVDAVDIVSAGRQSSSRSPGECLRAGQACFIEKPLALTVDEARPEANSPASAR